MRAAFGAGDIAAIAGNWLTIGSFSLLLVMWAVVSAIYLRRGVRRLCRVLDQSSARLARTPRSAKEFVTSYEAVSADFQNAPIIGAAWRDWTATLITPANPAATVRSTNRPSIYFSLELLPSCGINPRLHAAMPNLLVGVGLLLTFAGLAIALSSAGGIADPKVSPDVRQLALQNLLNVASAKFVTSLVGLFCSLTYASFRGKQLDRVERSLYQFNAALEERIPLATPASLQAESIGLLQESLNVQTQFATELAISIGGRLDAALDQRLGEHIGPLREAIEKLSEGVNTKSEDTLRTLLDQFKDMLQGSTQQHMEKLATALADMSGALEQIRIGLSEAASRMSNAADQIAEQMGRKADEAMSGITLQMEGLVDQLRMLAEQSRNAGNEAMAQAAARIAEAGDSFGSSARAIATSLEQTVSGITSRLGGEAEAATRRMTEELTRAVATMREVAEQNRAAGDDATRAMSDRIAQAAAGFERSAAQVAEALTSGAGDAASRLTSAVEELKEQFARLTADLTGNMQKAGSQFTEQGRDGGAALAEAAQAAAAFLRSGGQESGESLRSGGADAGRSLQAAAGEFAAPSRELGQRISSLQNEALELSRALTGMRQAALDSTIPLQGAAADLVKVGASGQKTTADLATAAQRIAPLVEAITGAMRQLGEAERRMATLGQELERALARFDGLDESLGGVFRALREGVTGFASQIRQLTTGADKDMARAVNALNSTVTELVEIVESLPPRVANTR